MVFTHTTNFLKDMLYIGFYKKRTECKSNNNPDIWPLMC